MRTIRFCLVSVVVMSLMPRARAHDLWFDMSCPIVPRGYQCHFSVMLGHVDECDIKHVDMNKLRFELVRPDGRRLLGRDCLANVGYPVGRFDADAAGVYMLGGVYDILKPQKHARGIRSTKAFVRGVDAWPDANRGGRAFSAPLGHALEFVPQSDPTRARVGQWFTAQLLFHGRPMSAAQVELILRQPASKRKLQVGKDGKVRFQFTQPGFYILAADFDDTSQKTAEYGLVMYGAALTLFVQDQTPRASQKGNR